MITTYAVSFTARDCTDQQRIAMVDLVSDWLVDHYPADERPAGTTVRTREAADDPVFRLTITESVPSMAHVQTITITVLYLNGSLTFDLRSVSSPTADKVVPHRSNQLPASIAHLVRRALAIAPVYDAEKLITPSVAVAATELEGQTIAGLALAPSRKLPLLIEFMDFERGTTPFFKDTVGPLVGLVHQYRVTTAEALEGFLQIFGGELIMPGTVAIAWAGKGDLGKTYLREMTPQNHDAERARLWQLIINNAARSIAAPRVPPPPVQFDEDDYFDEPTSSSMVNVGTQVSSDADADALAAQVQSLESTVDGLEAAMADADRIITELRADLEKKGKINDVLVQRNVQLEMTAGNDTAVVKTVATVAEAVDRAQKLCEYLVFHERAIESSRNLQGPDPSTVLSDLLRFNDVARQWMSRNITDQSIKIACSQLGLDYAPNVGDTARQKFTTDYAINWRGKTVLAEAHLRRGRKTHLTRIHVYFDKETQQVVVAYIGRHLRGKRDN